MTYHAGRRKCLWTGVLAAGMLSMLLLSSCGSTAVPVGNPTEPVPEEIQEEEKDQELAEYLLAMLSLKGQLVTADATLDSAAAFSMECVLLDPQAYLAGTATLDLPDYVHALLYDGSLLVPEVGRKVLDTLDQLTIEELKRYRQLENLSVVYGQGEAGSAWLVLAYYSEMGN